MKAWLAILGMLLAIPDYAAAINIFEAETSSRPEWYFLHYMLGLSYS